MVKALKKCIISQHSKDYRQQYTKYKKTEIISSKIRKERRMFSPSYLLNIVLELLAKTVRQEKEIKEI
jgi:hypothetical protein